MHVQFFSSCDHILILLRKLLMRAFSTPQSEVLNTRLWEDDYGYYIFLKYVIKQLNMRCHVFKVLALAHSNEGYLPPMKILILS